jgi:hypothetical protein
MYDPMSNSWSEQISEPFGSGNIGDAQSTILPNGTMLLADVLGSRDIASFSPNADPPTFTALDSRNKADSNDQENGTFSRTEESSLSMPGSKRPSKSTIPRPCRGEPPDPPWLTWQIPARAHSIRGRSDRLSCGLMAPSSPSLARIPVRTPSTTPRPTCGPQLARLETSPRSVPGEPITPWPTGRLLCCPMATCS